ncbi:MAG: F0F1 ATP synthase subunit A [Bdellovibrionales bacterium]|nr:F0F1 ATP synthase subunit A [Bdellovibrionales bacterium]
MVHFHWAQLLNFIKYNQLHIASSVLILFFSFFFYFFGKRALGTGRDAIVPSDKISLKAFFEGVLHFIASLVEIVMGKGHRQHVPVFAALFFYIFISNMFGLFPGFLPSTDNLNTTVAIGFFSFFIYNHCGFKEHGVGYLKQLLGPVLWMAPLMLVVELVSHFVRPFSLGLRLQGNMLGDHTVLSIFLNLVPYGVPVIFYALGAFVCFMQAFVFTMLSMIYVSMAISHDH